MRGIEGAVFALREVRGGGFASEIIRKHAGGMKDTDLSLCSSLVYAALRRETLWREIFTRFLNQKISPQVEEILLIGTAGILELKHFETAPLVSALVNETRKENAKFCPLVNAVLRRVEREGFAEMSKIKSSPILEDKALFAGVPKWAIPVWKKSRSNEEISSLLRNCAIKPYSSLRVSDEKNVLPLVERLRKNGLNAWRSPLVKKSVRISTTVFPVGLEGYDAGEFSPQTESSMLVGSLAGKFYRGGHVLDMCAGRGVKALQFLEETASAEIECWELSQARTRAGEREARRLQKSERISFKTGDALALEPEKKPSLILLDAPCSGSGTWTRRPESKWRTTSLDNLAKLQVSFLSRALSLIDSGGVIIYTTCSLFREENERVVSTALSAGARFLPVFDCLNAPFVQRGNPFGAYLLPSLPWIDGFFAAVIEKC